MNEKQPEAVLPLPPPMNEKQLDVIFPLPPNIDEYLELDVLLEPPIIF